MRLLDISHKYRYLLSRDPGSTPAEESQRALSKFNLAGKGASHSLQLSVKRIGSCRFAVSLLLHTSYLPFEVGAE